MKLKAWLKRKKMRNAEFAGLIGCTAPAVSFWVNQQRFPTMTMMKKIEEVTKGQVKANDMFY